MSITVSISAVQFHTPEKYVDADEMSNSRRSPSLISFSVGVDHLCCRRSHGSLRSFSLTGTIFLSIRSHFARVQSSRPQYFTSTSHIFMWFLSQLLLKVCFKKPPCIPQTSADWFHAVTSDAAVSDARILKIFVYAAKQACKQLQCNKAKLLNKWASHT